MNSLIASQVSCMFLLLLGTLLFGISPVFVKNSLFKCNCVGGTCKLNCRARVGKLITSYLIFFGGGVLLGTCLLHLLPESREGFEQKSEEVKDKVEQMLDNATFGGNDTMTKKDDEEHEKFSLPEFVVCCGFFAVYLFEEIIHYFLGGHTHVPTEARAIRSISRSSSCAAGPRHSDPGFLASDQFKAQNSGSFSSPPAVHIEPASAAEKFSIAGLLTVAALSFHSLFEGFAVGLRPDAVSTWVVFAAIAVHKYVIAFVVGLEVLAGGGKNIQVYVYMSIFSFMSPLGMAIAMITQSNVEDTSPLTVSVLNAIATGTLLYVTFFEILQRDEHKDISTWIQLIATASGFALMCIMQFASTLA